MFCFYCLYLSIALTELALFGFEHTYGLDCVLLNWTSQRHCHSFPIYKGKAVITPSEWSCSQHKKNQYFNKNLKNPFSNVHERKIYIQKLQISIYQSLIDCIFKPAVHAIITCFIFSDR